MSALKDYRILNHHAFGTNFIHYLPFLPIMSKQSQLIITFLTMLITMVRMKGYCKRVSLRKIFLLRVATALY